MRETGSSLGRIFVQQASTSKEGELQNIQFRAIAPPEAGLALVLLSEDSLIGRHLRFLELSSTPIAHVIDTPRTAPNHLTLPHRFSVVPPVSFALRSTDSFAKREPYPTLPSHQDSPLLRIRTEASRREVRSTASLIIIGI